MKHCATLLLLLAACGNQQAQQEKAATGPLRIVASHEVLAEFARTIAGDAATVTSLAVPHKDPATTRPSRAQLRRIQNADLVLLNGAGYETWATTVSLPVAATVVTARAFRTAWRTWPGQIRHSHGRGDEHTHEGFLGYTWLDPVLAKAQATAIRDACSARRPTQKDAFAGRFAALAAALDQLDATLRATTPRTPLPETFAYVAARYGWSSTTQASTTLDTCDDIAAGKNYVARMQGNIARLRN